jgi:hypothetical protein
VRSCLITTTGGRFNCINRHSVIRWLKRCHLGFKSTMLRRMHQERDLFFRVMEKYSGPTRWDSSNVANLLKSEKDLFSYLDSCLSQIVSDCNCQLSAGNVRTTRGFRNRSIFALGVSSEGERLERKDRKMRDSYTPPSEARCTAPRTWLTRPSL